jgi:hypothetical protein
MEDMELICSPSIQTLVKQGIVRVRFWNPKVTDFGACGLDASGTAVARLYVPRLPIGAGVPTSFTSLSNAANSGLAIRRSMNGIDVS